jgi:hypothetical protein
MDAISREVAGGAPDQIGATGTPRAVTREGRRSICALLKASLGGWIWTGVRSDASSVAAFRVLA